MKSTSAVEGLILVGVIDASDRSLHSSFECVMAGERELTLRDWMASRRRGRTLALVLRYMAAIYRCVRKWNIEMEVIT